MSAADPMPLADAVAHNLLDCVNGALLRLQEAADEISGALLRDEADDVLHVQLWVRLADAVAADVARYPELVGQYRRAVEVSAR